MSTTVPKLDQLASEVVLLTPADAASRRRVEQLLREIAQAETTPPAVSELAWHALVTVQGLTQAKDPAASLKSLSELLDAMAAAEAQPAAAVVDDPLIREFLRSQESTLQDYEAACLALAGGDPAALASLRRQIHTWKGEAGILSLKPLATAMHEVEEALGAAEAAPPDLLSDTLLHLGDAVGGYFRALQADQPAALDIAAVLAAIAPHTPVAPRRFALPAEIDMDLLQEFRTESLEHFQQAEIALLALEGNPTDSDAVNVVFRAFHTVKGVAGFVGISCVTDLAHKAETFFDRFRKHQLVMQGAYTDLAFEALDMLKVLLAGLDAAVAAGFVEAPAGYAALIRRLEAPEEVAAQATPPAGPARVGEILMRAGMAAPADVEQALAAQSDGDPRPVGEILIERQQARPQDVAHALRAQHPTDADATIKVSTARLDNLINMVGELVIAQSLVSQDPALLETKSARLVRNVSQLNTITRSLQELALSMRMVSVRATFQKMSRLVRDLARKSQKEIILETEGEDTELDRNMVEAIADPLVHMVRNAADHGVESPAERERAGKPRQGRILLRAAHEGGSVLITLTDDGRGLNAEKIRAKAVERGLVAPGATLSEAEIHRLIFLPGFSTADKVTDISGRGVGMDVVRTNIEALRGSVEITSGAGSGSTFRVRLPLTLAIIDGMVVRIGAERFILPIIAITETFQPRPDDLSTVTGQGEVVLLRGALLPVCRLGRLLRVAEAGMDLTASILVVVESKGRRLALMVDELLGQQQVVIKNLGRLFGSVTGVSGGAILGDGRVSLILDVDGLMTLNAN